MADLSHLSSKPDSRVIAELVVTMWSQMTMVLFSLVFAGASASSLSEGGALVFWSNKASAFEAEAQRTVLHLKSESEMASWLNGYLSSSTKPEILVVFDDAESSNSGADDTHSAVKYEVESSASSLVAPFSVAPASALWDLVPGEHLHATSLEEAKVLIDNHSDIAMNGVCDLLSIKLNGGGVELLKELQATVEKVTSGNCVFAIQPKIQTISYFFPEYTAVMTTSPRRKLLSDSDNSPKKYVHMTPDLLSGILTGLLLVVTAIIGLACLGGIQTPSQFTDKPPPSSREY
mmetsp:Transcript_44371/g.75492  ORF Transcript_44371/g.75492 Transcript_44371/m.75492 type:complete len:290 (-) Transcript_44371:243-1112(-)